MERLPCAHIMDSGRPCGSPRLLKARYCHWHNRLHTEHYLPGNPNYRPPVLDSPNAILLALNHVYRALAMGMITDKMARQLCVPLRLASQVVRRLDHPQPYEMALVPKHSTDIEQDPIPDELPAIHEPVPEDVAAPPPSQEMPKAARPGELLVLGPVSLDVSDDPERRESYRQYLIETYGSDDLLVCFDDQGRSSFRPRSEFGSLESTLASD